MRSTLAALVFLLFLGAAAVSAPPSDPVPLPPGTGGPAAPPAAPPAHRAAAGLRIVAPRAIEILSGIQSIEVAAPVQPPGAAAPTIEISVDGQVVVRLEAPPYRTSFDFGAGLGSRRIIARIVAGPGAGLSAELTTRGFDTRQVGQVTRVDLVTLYASVRSPSGKYITGLGRDQFIVTDSGRPQELSYFGTERRPLAVAIVIDSSFSMKGEPIAAAREAAIRFVKTLAPEDRAMVVSFSDDVRVLRDLTGDRDAAAAAVAAVESRGGTALYDAIYQVADRLSREEGRKVIVLLSDGRDEAQNGLEPGSLHTFEEALEKSLRSEVILFTIGFGKRLETERDFYGRVSLKEILDRLAADSGGISEFPQRPSQLKSAYELIGEELRNQYSLGYTPQPLRLDGQWHPIKLELKDPALRAITRRGYYAPKG